MIIDFSFLIVTLKYIACIFILICILLAPSYLAAFNGKDNYNTMFVRVSSVLMFWTGISWVWGLYKSVSK